MDHNMKVTQCRLVGDIKCHPLAYTTASVQKYTNRSMESVYAHPQCAAGMQSISKTDAAAILTDCGHCEHLP